MLKKYRYNASDQACLSRALDLVHSLHAFKRVYEVNIAVRAVPSLSMTVASGLFGSPVQAGDEHHTSYESQARGVEPVQKATRKSAKQPFPRVVVVRIDDTLNLETDHCILLSTLVKTLLQPYAMFRVNKGEATKLPSPHVVIMRLEPAALVTFAADVSRPSCFLSHAVTEATKFDLSVCSTLQDQSALHDIRCQA